MSSTQIINSKPRDFPRRLVRRGPRRTHAFSHDAPNVLRSRLFSQAWHVLYTHAGEPSSLPRDILVTVGFTSRGARGRLDRRAPAELLLGEWRRNPEEKGFLSVHPERTRSAEEIAMSMLFAIGRAAWGRGYKSIGVVKSGHALHFTKDEAGEKAARAVEKAVTIMADLPRGHAVIPEPEPAKRQKNYMLKWECPRCGMIVRARKKVNIACTSHRPGVRLVLAEARQKIHVVRKAA